MRFLRYLLPVVVIAAGVTSSAYADCSRESFHDETRQRDFEAVQEFVNSKRTISLEEKDCNLSISGDIRFDWAHIQERLCCQRLRGSKGVAREACDTGLVGTTNGVCGTRLVPNGTPFGNNVFDVEFNLYFDYVCDRAWGVAWLQFDEDAGIEHSRKDCCNNPDPQGLFGSGCCEDLCLKKAYLGYNIWADGCNRLDIEIGRRPLYTVFDSQVMYQSRFDGVLLKYGHPVECWGDFYWYLGGFVVDERVDHYAWITELGLLNIANYGFDFKYSFVDWKSLASHNVNRCGTRNPHGFHYQVHQWKLEYEFNPEYLCMPAKIYGAFIWNSDAQNLVLVNIAPNRNVGKQNIAWYAGFIVGEVCHAGDWSFEVRYEDVEAQAFPSFDASGIGGGSNVLGEALYANNRGFTNYRGWRFEGLYALTDNLSLDANLEFFKHKHRTIGGKHTYSKFEVEAIYAF